MQYDSAITSENFQTYLGATTLSDNTAAAISTLLNLDTATTVNLASWDGVAAPQIPTGQTGNTDVVTGTIAGVEGDTVVLNIPDSLNSAKAFILESDANLAVTFNPTVAAEAPVSETPVVEPAPVVEDAPADGPATFARLAITAEPLVAAEASKIALFADANAQVEFLVATGNGDDIITVNGDQNTYIDGGDGNDTITTGNGNNTVIAGAGNNNITTGTGNDTVVLSGTAHADIVNTGAGYDVVQLDGSVSDYLLTVNSTSKVTLTGAQTASITGAELLTFVNGDTLDTIALVQNQSEAAVLRLYDGILGRDVDAAGAQQWLAQASEGVSLSSIAANFVNSGEFTDGDNTAFINTLYTDLLGREGGIGGDTAGLQGWLSVLANGGTKADIVTGIATSQEAIAHDSSNGAFVESLYQAALGRGAEDAGKDSWISQLVNGASRSEVAQSILGSAEASEKANSDFVTDLYVNALGRTVEQVQADASKSVWTDALAHGTSQADVAIGIIGSQEAIAHIDNVVVLHGAV